MNYYMQKTEKVRELLAKFGQEATRKRTTTTGGGPSSIIGGVTTVDDLSMWLVVLPIEEGTLEIDDKSGVATISRAAATSQGVNRRAVDISLTPDTLNFPGNKGAAGDLPAVLISEGARRIILRDTRRLTY